MTTIKDLVAETRRMAYGSMSEQLNLIGAAAAAGATSIVLDMDVTGITPGMLLSTGLNVFYVRGTEPSTKTVFVIPGIDNAPLAAVAVNDFVYIKPKVTDWYLYELINTEIIRLSSPENGLYRIDSWTADVDPTYQTYEIPTADATSLIGILRIRYRMPGTSDVWIDIPSKSYTAQMNDGVSRIRLLRNIPSGTEINFQYKASFVKGTSLSSDVTTVCGLTDTMTDIPPLGALGTLMRTTESRRNQVQQQGDARTASEVSSGRNLTSGQISDRDYKTRVQEEYIRLVQRVPIVRSI
jgi:hypothetical protein